MTEAEIQVIVQEVMRRMLADDTTSNAANAASSQVGERATVSVTSVVTRSDIEAFAKEGKKRLLVRHGGLITPLARELAAEHGLEIVWSSESNTGDASKTQAGHALTSASSQSGKSALTCLRCCSCLEPAFYERALSEL